MSIAIHDIVRIVPFFVRSTEHHLRFIVTAVTDGAITAQCITGDNDKVLQLAAQAFVKVDIPAEVLTAVEQVKADIRDDVQNGTVPADVPDFSTLHSYVDANMYGGEAADGLWDVAFDGGDEFSGLNLMQEVVDGWIKSGGLREAEGGVKCTRCSAPVAYRPRLQAWVDTAAPEFSTCPQGGPHEVAKDAPPH